MQSLYIAAVIFICSITQTAAPANCRWEQFHNINKTTAGWQTTGPDPWMASAILDKPVPPEDSYLLLELTTSRPTKMQLFWRKANQSWQAEHIINFNIPACSTPAIYAVDLGAMGTFQGTEAIRLDPANDKGLTFQLKNLQFVPLSQVPAEKLPDLIQFRCFTSKLHYQPNQPIEYRATLIARNYPNRQSSKILQARLYDANDTLVGSDLQHFGLLPTYQIKELHGSIHISKPLKPGRYRLRTTCTDQQTNLTLEASHTFGIHGTDDPYLYETPFKFVKDFSVIRDTEGLWHIFSITGELAAGHDWQLDGQERTFSHGTSRDLRHWNYHKPVLSISDATYPDGRGKYKNRNVWAPHVIRHKDTYYMFYTSVNEYVSQSISLATSPDLFHWQDYAQNPVFTLEDAGWALWRRDGWADCRDPMVLVDGNDFYLYVTAQAKKGHERGIVAVAHSNDLIHWDNPQIAVRGNIISESPQVWKEKGRYFMTTSSHGAATYVSEHPAVGWKRIDFPRPDIQKAERYVQTSGSYAEEVVRLKDGSLMMAALTFRYWGNSIYFFHVKTDDSGLPTGYESPFDLP